MFVPASLILVVFGAWTAHQGGWSYSQTWLWLGVTVLAMYFLGAIGLWSSVRCKGSWRSLLSTLGFGYVGGFLVYLMTTPVLFILALLVWVILILIDKYIGTSLAPGTTAGFAQYWEAFKITTCIGLAVTFWLAGMVAAAPAGLMRATAALPAPGPF